MHIYKLHHIKTKSIPLTSCTQPEKGRAGNLVLLCPLYCWDPESLHTEQTLGLSRAIPSCSVARQDGAEGRGGAATHTMRTAPGIHPSTVYRDKCQFKRCYSHDKNIPGMKARVLIYAAPLQLTQATSPHHLTPYVPCEAVHV